MLLLLFYVGDDRYALESKHVVEVVPLVALKKQHHAPDYLAGLFNYRSRIIPAIDLCHLMGGTPCRTHLSTRIIIVSYHDSEGTPRLLGLMAERITETINRQDSEFVDPEMMVDRSPYLGKIVTDDLGMIQCIRVENLLPSSQQAYLLQGYNE